MKEYKINADVRLVDGPTRGCRLRILTGNGDDCFEQPIGESLYKELKGLDSTEEVRKPLTPTEAFERYCCGKAIATDDYTFYCGSRKGVRKTNANGDEQPYALPAEAFIDAQFYAVDI